VAAIPGTGTAAVGIEVGAVVVKDGRTCGTAGGWAGRVGGVSHLDENKQKYSFRKVTQLYHIGCTTTKE
jgi:deoxycytidylate deaminase